MILATHHQRPRQLIVQSLLFFRPAGHHETDVQSYDRQKFTKIADECLTQADSPTLHIGHAQAEHAFAKSRLFI